MKIPVIILSGFLGEREDNSAVVPAEREQGKRAESRSSNE